MKKTKLFYVLPIFLFAIILLAADFSYAKNEDSSKAKSENSKTSNAPVNDENFDKMMSVLMHKRCVNCHPSDNVPKQGEDSHPHYFDMARENGKDVNAATNCNTCHQEENNDFSGVPGAPEWSLAPAGMKWEGLSRTEIAESMLDPKRNGGRTHHQVEEHLTEHALVLWAWTPGIDAAGNPREKPPVPKDEYIKAVKEWFHDGAVIPAK